MNKKFIFGLLAICLCSALLFTGCGKKDDAAKTATVKTPIQLVNESLWQYKVTTDNALATHGNSIANIVSRVGTLETAVSGLTAFDPAPLTARVGVLESLNISDFAGGLSFLTVRVATLESYNISARLAALEARCNASPTVTPNGSTPTPTPIPTVAVNCTLVTKPVAIYPTHGNMSIVNGSILFQWVDSNASGYEFWFGTNPASLLKVDTLSKDALFYPFPATGSNTYYFWRVVALSSCGNLSTMWWFKTQ